MRSRCFLPCAYRLEVKYCGVLRVSIYNFLVHYKLQIPGTLQLHHIVQLSGKIQIPLKVAVRRKKETLKN